MHHCFRHHSMQQHASSTFMHAHLIDFTFYVGEEVDLQSLVKHLLNIAPKWQLLGEQLGVSDILLDEIFTNYGTPEVLVHHQHVPSGQILGCVLTV